MSVLDGTDATHQGTRFGMTGESEARFDEALKMPGNMALELGESDSGHIEVRT